MSPSDPPEADETKAGTKERSEGWEGLAGDEPSGGSLSPSEELEAALREASEAVEQARGSSGSGKGAQSSDKLLLEVLSGELQELKKAYEAVQQELAEAQDKELRLQAEFENFRRRQLKDRQESLQFGHQNLVKELLATVDNLDRAIDHSEQSGGGDLEGLLQGVELVRRELHAVLTKFGVAEIVAENVPFDPALHEGMAQVPSTAEPNTVVQVLQKGYQLRDRMLRPARVVVARAPSEGEQVQHYAESVSDSDEVGPDKDEEASE